MSDIDRAVEADDFRRINQMGEEDYVDSQCHLCKEEFYSGQNMSHPIWSLGRDLRLAGNLAGKDICRNCLVEKFVSHLYKEELDHLKEIL